MEYEQRLRVLQITSMYPTEDNPAFGIFVKSQIDSLRPFVDIDLIVLKGLSGPIPYVLSIPNLIRKLYFNNSDLIHVHYGNVSSLVKLIYWGKKPIVTSYCGDDLQGTLIGPGKYTKKSLFFRVINKLLARRDTFSIVKSQLLAKNLGLANKIEVIPNGIDLKLFQGIDKITARKKIGAPLSNIKILLFPAAPEIPVKNFQLLQSALNELPNERIFLLTFSGNKVERHLAPYYFNAADLVVFTSLSEGSPNVIKEAMACNCRIYTTNCGDVAWLLDGVEGSKILSYNVEEWVHELSLFVSSDLLIESNSRIRLKEKLLDGDSVAARILSIYKEIITPANK